MYSLLVSWPVGDSAERWHQVEEPLQAARRAFDAEIAQRVSAIRKQRNISLSPFSKLPQELHIAILDTHLSHCDPTQVNSRRRLLAKVSSSWRTMILSTPFLWRCVDLNDPLRLLPTTFQRSVTSPLLVTGHFRYESVFGAQSRLAQLELHKARLRTLHMAGSYTSGLIQILKSALPALEVLEWHHRVSRTALELTLGEVPRLRHLMLEGVFLSPASQAMTHLEVLNLSRARLHAEDLLAILHLSPRLKNLSLTEIDQADVIIPSPHTPISVELPNLTQLRLNAVHPAVMAQIFQCLDADGLEYVEVMDLPNIHGALLSLITAGRLPLLSTFIQRSASDFILLTTEELGNRRTIDVSGVNGTRVAFRLCFMHRNLIHEPPRIVRATGDLLGEAWLSLLVHWRMNEQTSSVDWDQDSLSVLSNVLNLRQLTIGDECCCWDRLVAYMGQADDLGQLPWPKLVRVQFPVDIDSGLMSAKAPANRLVASRGGSVEKKKGAGRNFGRTGVRYKWKAGSHQGARED